MLTLVHPDGTAEAAACLLNTLQPGTALVASGYCLYSSSCMFVLTIGAGTHGAHLLAARLLRPRQHPWRAGLPCLPHP